MVLALLAAFVAIAALALLDVLADLHEGTTISHVLLEVAVVVIGLAGAAGMGRRLVGITRRERTTRLEAEHLAERLEHSKQEAAHWREEAQALLHGLGQALDRQFARWELSPAEKDVALLLLKGLSHKEIAELRGVTEDTARQQARAVYRKGGLTGRHDLAAFFLEDLMLPNGMVDDPVRFDE